MVATTVFCLRVEQHCGLRWLGFLHLSQLVPQSLHSFCLSASLFVCVCLGPPTSHILIYFSGTLTSS